MGPYSEMVHNGYISVPDLGSIARRRVLSTSARGKEFKARMPWKGTRLFISVFMKNPLLPLWALQIAAALIILKLHIAFALTEPRLIADVGLTDNRCRIRVSSCKPEAAPRGYTCCGPQAPGPLVDELRGLATI